MRVTLAATSVRPSAANITPARVADASSAATTARFCRSTTLTRPGVVSSAPRAAWYASNAPFGEKASADTGPQMPEQWYFSGSALLSSQ